MFVFVPASAVYTALTFTCGCCLCLHTAVWPYARRRDNLAEWIALFALFAQCSVIAMRPLPWLHTADAASLALSVAFVLLLVVLPAAAVLTCALWDRLRQCRHQQRRQQEEKQQLEEEKEAL